MSRFVFSGSTKITFLPLSDAIDHLDEDWALPCQTDNGERIAVWIMWLVRCCPQVPPYWLTCQRCLDLMSRSDFAICRSCRHVYTPASISWTSVEPINGKPS